MFYLTSKFHDKRVHTFGFMEGGGGGGGAFEAMDKNGKYLEFYGAKRSDQRHNTTKVLVRRSFD